MRGIVTATLSAAGLIAAVTVAPPVQAADRWSLNGPFTAT